MNTQETSFRVAMDSISSDILEAYRQVKSMGQSGLGTETDLYAERIRGSLERALEKLAPMGIHANTFWDSAREN